jgi:hypothetical protein
MDMNAERDKGGLRPLTSGYFFFFLLSLLWRVKSQECVVSFCVIGGIETDVWDGGMVVRRERRSREEGGQGEGRRRRVCSAKFSLGAAEEKKNLAALTTTKHTA